MNKCIRCMLLCIVLMTLFSACEQSEGEAFTVKIHDGMTTTILDSYKGHQVSDLLVEAELSLGEKDLVTPGLEEVITQEGSEIEIARYAAVSVCVGEESPVPVELTGASVKDAVEASGISIDENDYVDLDMDRLLEDGMRIHITERAAVKLVCDGKKSKDITDAKTVGEYLKAKGIQLDKKDRLNKKKNAKITEGMKIVVKRVTEEEVTEKESIDYGTEYESSNSMYTGETKVKQNGVKGEKEILYRVTYVDGVEESREKIEEHVIKEPVSEIILKGTKAKPVQKPQSSQKPDSKPEKPSRTIVSKDYNDDCDGSGHGVLYITYSDGTVERVEY